MATTPSALRTLASNPPTDTQTRQELYDAARELMFAVESPMDTEHRIFFGQVPIDIASAATNLKLFDTLAADSEKQWSVKELAEGCGAEEVLLHRLLRYLAATGMVSEVSSSTYAASHITPRLAAPAFKSGLHFHAATSHPALRTLPDFLAETKYTNPSNPKTNALTKWNGGQDIMSYIMSNPDLASSMFQYMAEHKAVAPTFFATSSIPFDDFKLSEQEVKDGRVLMVDIGGGAGHQCIGLRKAHPELKGKMIVQDMAHQTDQIDRQEAAALDLEPMAHDFMSPQPVKSAKVYYLRNVLHDWSTEVCLKILTHVREAMGPDSVVVVDEIVIPSVGASAKQTHYDLVMMSVASAMERTKEQWNEMFGAVGLRVRDVHTYDPVLESALIVGVPV